MHTNIFFIFSLVSLMMNFVHVFSGQSDALVLACGIVDSERDRDGRIWTSDSKFVNSGESFAMVAKSPVPEIDMLIPYKSSRIFKSEVTYLFPVKPDTRYWLRLHFFPNIYGDFDTTHSYFSLSVNGIILLKNFSASITCQAFSEAYLIREYSLAPLNSEILLLVFKPVDGSFAFINGIEVVQMPDLFDSAKRVGSTERIDVKRYHSQTMYRLNVGGQYISPSKDSGLTRRWNDDSPFIRGAAFGRVDYAGGDIKIQYQGVPEYVAPAEVYSSSRSMGSSKKVTMAFNLTWIFQVDTNSTYLFRFHFCDFVYNKSNALVFSININNKTAESAADVIKWSGGKGRATYQDYLTDFSNASGDEKLWVSLHPSSESDPDYLDAILNGLEILKVSNSTLASPNPPFKNIVMKNENGYKVIRVAVGGAALLMAVVCVVLYQRKKRRVYGIEKSTSPNTSAAKQGLCRHFTLAEIKHATGSFDEVNLIGEGGFGKVYRGVIDGEGNVAVKRSNPSSEQGVNEFQTEVEMLSKLRHRHLVSLIGCCEEESELCLIYEYISRGTLREHLYDTKQPLSWKQRLEVCVGAAKGLEYLHSGIKFPIYHRDIKSSNILLDEIWEAKVSDFGLSKTGPNTNNGHVTTAVKGTPGYIDPEYFKKQHLTEKSDVYSFGIVLLEVLCARPVINPSLAKEEVSLADWFLNCMKKGLVKNIIDSSIKEEIDPECLKKFTSIAEKCLAKEGQERPSMGEVLWSLEFALALQLQAEHNANSSPSSRSKESSIPDVSLHSNNMAIHRNNLSIGSGSENETSDD